MKDMKDLETLKEKELAEIAERIQNTISLFRKIACVLAVIIAVAFIFFHVRKDYNNYSGWMLKIGDGKEAPYNGVDTVLTDKDVVVLDFSMMMGLDVGLNGYMQDSTGQWVFQKAWN